MIGPLRRANPVRGGAVGAIIVTVKDIALQGRQVRAALGRLGADKDRRTGGVAPSGRLAGMSSSFRPRCLSREVCFCFDVRRLRKPHLSTASHPNYRSAISHQAGLDGIAPARDSNHAVP